MHKGWVLLSPWEMESRPSFPCVSEVIRVKGEGESTGCEKRDTRSVRMAPKDLWSDQQAPVCVAGLGKGDVAEGCTKYNGVELEEGR